MPTVPTRPGPKGADCDPLHHCHQMMLAPYYHMQIKKNSFVSRWFLNLLVKGFPAIFFALLGVLMRLASDIGRH